MSTSLGHPRHLDLDTFARACNLHPDHVRRLMALGLLEPDHEADGEPWFVAAQLRRVARIERLRAGLALNYAACGVVLELLDRIAELEATLAAARRPPARGGRQ